MTGQLAARHPRQLDRPQLSVVNLWWASHQSATASPLLVLDEAALGAGGNELLDSALHVQHVATACHRRAVQLSGRTGELKAPTPLPAETTN